MTPLNVTTAPARGSRTAAASVSSDSGSARTATCGAVAAPPDTGGISASSSPALQRLVLRRVLAVDREHERQPAGQVVDGRQGVGDPRALRRLELEPIAPGPLAQGREEADVDEHVRQGSQIGDT